MKLIPFQDRLDLREIGSLAVWSLSTAKPGNGVEQLRDDNLDSYWQSDGPVPHLVNVQFYKKMRIQEVAVYVNFSLDESYTPSRISIRAGSNLHDLQEIRCVTVEEPKGWCTVSVSSASGKGCLRAHLLQIAILANHQGGRDTHVRQIKIYGPRQPTARECAFPQFTTVEFSQFACVR
mmetsp:Transcript_40000/g.66838  ORF Transcript_40000/g.66838 Transcript_40000/m.66838 type:complete len:178 (-) Transcript_40000:32-565(-)